MAQKSGFRFAAIPLMLLLVAFMMTRDEPWTVWRVAGLALMVPGFALWGMAHIQLGESFSVRPEARALVTRGLYSRFRSPIYLFGGIGVAGFALAIGQPLWLLAFLVLIPMQIVRTRREAHVLEEKFGEEYREYARHTWI